MLKFIIPIFLFSFNLFGTDFKFIKEKEIEIFYEKEVNPYKVEYVIQVLKNTKNTLTEKFGFTNFKNFKIFIYQDTINFISDGVGKWWHNYIFKSNILYIQNIETLMQQNILHKVLCYAFSRFQIIENFDKNRIPEWFFVGLALYFSKLNFNDQGIIFKNFNELINNLNNNSFNQEKFYQASHNIYGGISYLSERFGFDKLIELINVSQTESDFEKNFFQFFGITLNDFKEIILGK